MAQSIKKYFQEAYDNEIFDVINDYVQEHPKELEEKFSQLHRMGNLTLEYIEVMAVHSELGFDNNMHFEIVVRATIDCVEGNHHYDDEREEECWYSVMGTGNLENLLQDFTFVGVTPYKGRSYCYSGLNDSFVPNIKKANLDKVAEKFLENYYPEALKKPIAIDTDLLLKRVKLTKIEHTISADKSVFGRIYFEAADVDFCKEGNQFETVHIEPGTVLVDPEVFFLRTMGSLNNTIVHECVHWVYHRPIYLLEKINNDALTQLDCAVVGGVRGRKWSTAATIEWQANALTPRIQMPAQTFKIAVDTLLTQLMEEKQTNSVREVIEDVIAQLAEKFGVSKLSAKIRMVELGYEVARGAYIYVDGAYIRPFTYKSGYMKPYQTFCVSFEDAAKLRLMSMDLREDPRSKDFVYVDSHFVHNHPKYVEQTDDGLQMTDYALEHMDECCLIFKMSIASGCEKEYHTVCYFNRDTDSNMRFVVQYDSGLEKASQKEKNKAECEAIRAAYNRLNTLPAGYNYALQVLIDESGMTIEEIADETYISEKTIRRILKGDKEGGSYENLAYICLSLQLHPVISSFIIERAPWKCDFRKLNHVAIKEALRSYYGHKMSFIHDKIAALSS